MPRVTVLPPKKICEVCGAEVESTANFCGNCGFPVGDILDDLDYKQNYDIVPEPPPIQKKQKSSQNLQQKQQQQQPKNNSNAVSTPKCPRCGSTNFKSCEMIYNSGTRTRSFNSSTGYSSHGTNSTLLAQSVAPPFKKSTYYKKGFFFSILTYFLMSSDLSIISGSVALYYFLKSFVRSDYNHYEYQKDYDKWANTFVCSKCGEKFLINK